MRILIDIGHPGHVHLFRNFISTMQKKGWQVFITTKSDRSITSLLDLYGFKYMKLGKKSPSLLLKYLFQVFYLLKVFWIILRYRIRFALGVSMTLPVFSFLPGLTVIGFDDDDMSVTPVFAKFVNKSNVILTPDCLKHDHRGKNHIAYPGYHELAYLHPNRFMPDIKVLKDVGLSEGEVYFVLRFNAFQAHHDIGAAGLNLDQKRRLIEILSEKGRVLISTEKEIDLEFKKYQISLPPDKIHSLLYFATIFAGDSQTMTTEAAILGTPAVKCNTFAGKLSVPNEIEKYGLCYSFQPADSEKFFEKIEDLLTIPDLKKEWGKRRDNLLKEKIDVTAFIIDLVVNYPASKKFLLK